MSSGLQYDLQRMPVPTQSLRFHSNTAETTHSFQPGLRFSSDLYLHDIGRIAGRSGGLGYDDAGYLADPLKSNPSPAQGYRSSLLLATASSPSLRKRTDVSLSQTSPTFIETRSLLPGSNHLSHAHGSYARTVQTPSPPVDPPLRPARPSLDSTRSTSSNRTMTVQRLALDLPLSSGGSLSALIHALEDAAPGWYQSLLDTVTPQDPSPASSPVLVESPPLTQASEPRCCDSEPVLYGLSADMLASLDALEAVAARVRQLPVPRQKNRVFEDIGAAFVCSPDPTELTFKSYMPQLASPPSTPPEDQQRRRQASSATLSPEDTPRMRSRSSSATSYRSASTHTTAVSNIVNHPKLSKTLGLGAVVPGGLPAQANTAKQPASSVQASAAELPHVLHKKASTKSLKTPKTPKTLKSIFRSKPPPVPSLPDYDEDDSPVRKPPLKYRFSDGSVLRREDRRIDSVMSMKRPFGSDSVPGRHVDADSFLFM